MSDETILAELLERRTYAATEWADIREEAATDMRYVAGDPWSTKDRKAREDAGRPCLSLDELGQYHNQVINDLRENPRGMIFSPTGNGANDKGAQVYQEKAREIEYRSSAQIAYITAAENMIQRSYGWVRVKTAYEHDRSMNQDLSIEPCMNPDAVLADPDALWPDSRDMNYLFNLESRLKKEFIREYGKDARITNFSLSSGPHAKEWLHDDRIDVGEYWTKEPYRRTLIMVTMPPPPPAFGTAPTPQRPSAPVGLFEDELPEGKLPPGAQPGQTRTVDAFRVMQYLTNGFEILKTTRWVGKHIPFVSFLGKVLYLADDTGVTRKILSMTRLARDPYMLYCYYRTCEAELVGMTPKFPYFVYRGALLPDQLLALQKSLHEPIAVIQVEPTVPGAPPGQVIAFPTRQPYEPPIQGLEMGAEAARRAIQASMGISPLPTTALRHNEKSGKALQQIEESGQRGSFHFTDHYNGGIQRVGVIVEDLLDKVIDNIRQLGVMKADMTPRTVSVNDSNDPESVSLAGDYLVTVSSGPSTANERDAADDFMDATVRNLQTIAQVSGPPVAAAVLSKAIRLKNLGPIGDQIADLIEPAQFKTEDGKKPLPPEAQALQGQLQQVQTQLQQAGEIIKTEQAKHEAQFKIEEMKADKDAALKLLLQKRELAAKIEIARIGAAKQAADTQAESIEERLALALDSIDDAKDRQHDLILAHVDHAHTVEQADQAHGHALAQGDQGVQGQIAVQAAQPQPQSQADGTGM